MASSGTPQQTTVLTHFRKRKKASNKQLTTQLQLAHHTYSPLDTTTN